jgi:outer membrane lipoprotein SlyB
MKLHRIAAVATLGTFLSLPVSLVAQEYALLQHVSQSGHDRAEREQTEKDHSNHTGAKIVGGSAAGGAVVGALAGGGKGALIGGAVGAGGGAIANKVRKDKAVKNREQRESDYHNNHHDYPR